jgi:hypothetical protein
MQRSEYESNIEIPVKLTNEWKSIENSNQVIQKSVLKAKDVEMTPAQSQELLKQQEDSNKENSSLIQNVG